MTRFAGTLTLALVAAAVGCQSDSASQRQADPIRTTKQVSTRAADPLVSITALELEKELLQSVRDELAKYPEANLGTNAWRDMDQIVSDGVVRLQIDGMTQSRVALARKNVDRLAEKAAAVAKDSPNPNITRVELMAALSKLSPLYPYVVEVIPPAVAPVPGTPVDPPVPGDPRPGAAE